jgi:hypothetical protein
VALDGIIDGAMVRDMVEDPCGLPLLDVHGSMSARQRFTDPDGNTLRRWRTITDRERA